MSEQNVNELVSRVFKRLLVLYGEPDKTSDKKYDLSVYETFYKCSQVTSIKSRLTAFYKSFDKMASHLKQQGKTLVYHKLEDEYLEKAKAAGNKTIIKTPQTDSKKR